MPTADAYPVIDADGHVAEPPATWTDYVEPRYRGRAPRTALDEHGHPCIVVDDRMIMRHAMLLTLGPQYELARLQSPSGGWDAHARLRAMDAEGIDAAVLYPSVGLYLAEVQDPALLAALCRAYNDWLADFCQASPRRLIGVALLPLADVEESVRELQRAVGKLGFRGALVRPNPCAGRPLHHPCYERLWQCAAALEVSVSVHEGLSDSLPTLGRDRFENPVLLHATSHPFELMAACAGLILTGVLERYERLRFAFLEAGCAWVPYWLQRLDAHWRHWASALPTVRRAPSEYFTRQCVVSATAADGALVPSVARHVGSAVLVWASEYPHPTAVYPGALAAVRTAIDALGNNERAAILGANAARVYGLPAGQ